MSIYKDSIDAYFAKNSDAMLSDIAKLVAINSVREEAAENMPFGPGPYKTLKLALKMGEEMGFKVRNVDNFAGVIECEGAEPELGILAHLDIVEAGEGWTFEPFYMKIDGERIYGRGTSDDKGPAMAALYALAAAREIDSEKAKKTRIILGCAEETGSECMAYYGLKEAFPKNVFSPDAAFPVINIEKGGYAPVFEARWGTGGELQRIVSMEGGGVTNVVPRKAHAEIEGLELGTIEPFCLEAQKKTGASFKLISIGNQIRIEAEGKNAHAAAPDAGNNALTALLSLVAALPVAKSKGFTRLQSMAKLFPHGDNAGNALGIAMSDDLSGDLTLALSVFKMDETGLRAQFDSRVPLCGNDENVRRVAERALAAEQLIITSGEAMRPAHQTTEDSPFVQTLLKAYEDWTGSVGFCIAIGGGTYVHDIEGGVAFGCAMPGKSDGNIHGPDEFANISDLITSAKIFTDVILSM